MELCFNNRAEFLRQFKKYNIAIYISTKTEYTNLMEFFDICDIRWRDHRYKLASEIDEFRDNLDLCIGFDSSKDKCGLYIIPLRLCLTESAVVIPYERIGILVEKSIKNHKAIPKIKRIYKMIDELLFEIEKIQDTMCYKTLDCFDCPLQYIECFSHSPECKLSDLKKFLIQNFDK